MKLKMNFHEDEAKNNEEGTCENSGNTRISKVKPLIKNLERKSNKTKSYLNKQNRIE